MFVPSHGLGEIYMNPTRMSWIMKNSSFFDKKKDIPLFQFVLDMESLLCRYLQRISSLTSQNIWERILIKDFDKISKRLNYNFKKIISLSEDLFCTGDIMDNVQCVKTLEQFINNEPIDFFDFGEIKEILDLIEIELSSFKKLLDNLIMTCSFFIMIDDNNG